MGDAHTAIVNLLDAEIKEKLPTEARNKLGYWDWLEELADKILEVIAKQCSEAEH